MSNQIHLNSLINSHQFLSIEPSKTLYPDSKGSGLEILRVTTELFEAHISLQGAQLLYFKPKNGSQLLWLSPNCDFTPGVALRGGIPLCLPWFGPHPTDSTKPKHGFARNREWQLTHINQSENQRLELEFLFEHSADNLFAQNFRAQLILTLSHSIEIELVVTNLSGREMDCSFVFHSYHPVEELATTKVLGLKNRAYLDNLESHQKKLQIEDVLFPGEVDRVFQNIENPLTIMGQPKIQIEHENCSSVVVWNCGAINAQKITDIGAGNDQRYVCVERGNVLDCKWQLKSESRRAKIHISEITTSHF